MEYEELSIKFGLRNNDVKEILPKLDIILHNLLFSSDFIFQIVNDKKFSFI